MADIAKDPWYPWYPRDFAGDEPVQLMSLEAEGAYHRLLDHQWLHGSIPADLPQLAAICKRQSLPRMRKLWRELETLFPLEPEPGRRQNRRLERIRADRERNRRQQSEAGRRGAERRWGRDMASPEPNDSEAMATPSGGHGDPTDSPMRSDSKPLSLAPAPAPAVPQTPPTAPQSAAAAARVRADSALVDRVHAKLDPLGQAALDGWLATAPNPSALLRDLEAMGTAMPGHPHFPWPVISRGLHELAVAGGQFTAKRLQVFCRDIVTTDRATAAAGTSTGDGLDEWVRRTEDEERAAREARPTGRTAAGGLRG